MLTTLLHTLQPNLLRPLLHIIMTTPELILTSLQISPVVKVVAKEVIEVMVVVQPQGVKFVATTVTQLYNATTSIPKPALCKPT